MKSFMRSIVPFGIEKPPPFTGFRRFYAYFVDKRAKVG